MTPSPEPVVETVDPRTLRVGTPVVVAFRKFDGTPHWTYPARYLGCDEFGGWIGGRPGTVLERPGRQFIWDGDFVLLLPWQRHHVVTLNGPTALVNSEFYVDITTVPRWLSPRSAGATGPGAGGGGAGGGGAGGVGADRRGAGGSTGEWTVVVEAIDLDLDVMRRFGEREPIVDDEDEFEEHRITYAYPADLVSSARAETVWVEQQIRENAEPYASVAYSWLARVPALDEA